MDLLPNRGALVRQVTAHDVREICQVRRVLECEATRRAVGRSNLSELPELARAMRRLATIKQPSAGALIDEARTLDSRLHDSIAASCGNAFLAKELSRLKTLFRAFRDVSYIHHEAHNDYRRLAEEAREHLAVVEALLAGDKKEAARAMQLHIRHGVKYWPRALPGAAPANGKGHAPAKAAP